MIGIGLYYLAPQIKISSMISDWMSFYIFFALGDAISSFFFKNTAQQFLKSNVVLTLMIPTFILTQVYYLSHEVGLEEFMIIALLGCLSMFVLAYHLQKWNALSISAGIGLSLPIYLCNACYCFRLYQVAPDQDPGHLKPRQYCYLQALRPE